MVQPVAASPSCIQSYSPCSLISDLIQRVAECVTSIFHAIAYFVNCSFCCGQEAPTPALSPIAAPALAAPVRAFTPVEMIESADDLSTAEYRIAVANGTRFLLDTLRVLKADNPIYYDRLLAKMETDPNAGDTFSLFFIRHLLSMPSLEHPNAGLLDLRTRFAALPENQKEIVMVSLQYTGYYSPGTALATDMLIGDVRGLAPSFREADMFFDCAQEVRTELASAGEMLYPEVLRREGVQFLLHEYKHTDASQHQGLLARFSHCEEDCFSRLLVYQTVFPVSVIGDSEAGSRFLDFLMQTRAARAMEKQIQDLTTTFLAFSAEERRNALEAWMDMKAPTAATADFLNLLTWLKNDFSRMDVLKRSAIIARDQLSRSGLLR